METSVLDRLVAPSRCRGCGVAGPLACRGCQKACPPAAGGSLPDGVDRVIAAWDYRGLARSLILDLKMRGLAAAARPLSAAAAQAVWRNGLVGSSVTWVPGRRADVVRRGFDHAQLIAAGLARRLGLPLVAALARVADPPHQTGLPRARRLAAPEGAFVATSSPASIVLVDDLVTTGATASACARALRAGGAGHLELVVVCRA